MTGKRKKSVGRYLTAVCVVACWLLIWPVGILKDEKISRTAADYSQNTGPIGEVAAIQEFVPQYDHIKSIGVDIGKLNGQAKVPQDISQMRDGELTDIPVDMVLEAGKRYYLSIQCEDYGDMPPVLHYRSLAGNGPSENLHFYYGPVVIEDASANIRYIYRIPLNLVQILFYDSLIFLLGVIIYSLLGKSDRGSEESE